MRRFIVGVDFGGTEIRSAVFTSSFEKVAVYSIATQSEQGAAAVLHRIEDCITSVLFAANVVLEEVMCIGLGIPCFLNRHTGHTLFSPEYPDWNNVAVVAYFQNVFKIPVFIDKDVRMHLFGEWFFGAGKGKKNILVLSIGRRLDAAVVMDGRVLYGATDSAADISHIPAVPGGRRCSCGEHGCLCRYVSAVGVIKTFQEEISVSSDSGLQSKLPVDMISAEMITQACQDGDKAALATMHRTGEILGESLVQFIALFNPEIVIIGGGLSRAGDFLLNSAQKVVTQRLRRFERRECPLVISPLQSDGTLLGCAVHAARCLAAAKEKNITVHSGL